MSAALSFLAGNGPSRGFFTDNSFSGEDAADVFKKVDSLLTYYSKQQGEDNEKFNSASFGTIAHLCVEALLSNMVPLIPPKLAGFLRPADADALLNAGKELALRFTRSPLGIIAKESEGRKSEFPFRTLTYSDGNEIFINGVIDLVFEDSQTVYVVDFKTDTQELPGEHITQMACYYRAASDLFSVHTGKECRVWLYYLRSGHAVEVTSVLQNTMQAKALQNV
jgi:ATP-dependent helicase/nuclease subunit A